MIEMNDKKMFDWILNINVWKWNKGNAKVTGNGTVEQRPEVYFIVLSD